MSLLEEGHPVRNSGPNSRGQKEKKKKKEQQLGEKFVVTLVKVKI